MKNEINETQFIEYLDRCEEGALLAELNCIGGDDTHYFIVNNNIPSTVKILKMLAAYRYHNCERNYIDGGGIESIINVKNIVIITTKPLLPIISLCQEVDDIIVVNNHELECLNDFANIKHPDFKFLYSNISEDDDLHYALFGITEYTAQLTLPVDVLSKKTSNFKVSQNSLKLADKFIEKNNFYPETTIIIVNFATNSDLHCNPTIWTDLLKYSKELNYTVFTYAKTPDQVLPTTLPLSIDIDILFALMLRGCKVVSLENMLIDLMKLVNLQHLKALVVFNLNDNTKKLSENKNVFKEVYENNKIFYIAKTTQSDLELSNVIVEQFKEIFKCSFIKTHYRYGLELAKKICTNEPETNYIILNFHIGDAYTNLSSVGPFKKYYQDASDNHLSDEQVYNNINCELIKGKKVSKVVIVTTNLLSGVARMCEDVDDIIILDQNGLDLLSVYALLPNKIHRNLYPDRCHNSYEMLNLYNMYALNKCIMLPIKFQHEYPSRFGFSDKIINETNKLISELNINIAKTIILVPLARSSSSLTQEDLQLLIDYTNNNGYDVYTNCGPNQEALDGTKRLEVPLDIFSSIVNMGAMVVGVQCGIMDLLLWLKKPNIKVITVMPIREHFDDYYAKRRNITEQITKVDNFTFIKKEENEPEQLDELILQEFKHKYENSEE